MKREPVLIAAVVVAVVNLIAGGDVGLNADTVAALFALVIGAVTRQKVTPLE